jgi:hypothetical protein
VSTVTFKVVGGSQWAADGDIYAAGETHTVSGKTLRLLAASAASEPSMFEILDGQEELDRQASRHLEDDDKSVAARGRTMKARAALPADVRGKIDQDRDAQLAAIAKATAKAVADAKTDEARAAHEEAAAKTSVVQMEHEAALDAAAAGKKD